MNASRRGFWRNNRAENSQWLIDCELEADRPSMAARGNLAPDRGLEVFNTQWLGDDVRVCFRTEGMDPDHSEMMTAAGLAPGDCIGTELYPEIWARSG